MPAFILHADVIAGFAFDEESGDLNLMKGPDGKAFFVPRPELEVNQDLFRRLAVSANFAYVP